MGCTYEEESRRIWSLWVPHIWLIWKDRRKETGSKRVRQRKRQSKALGGLRHEPHTITPGSYLYKKYGGYM